MNTHKVCIALFIYLLEFPEKNVFEEREIICKASWSDINETISLDLEIFGEVYGWWMKLNKDLGDSISEQLLVFIVLLVLKG